MFVGVGKSKHIFTLSSSRCRLHNKNTLNDYRTATSTAQSFLRASFIPDSRDTF